MKQSRLFLVLFLAGLMTGCDWVDKKEISLVCSVTTNVWEVENKKIIRSETKNLSWSLRFVQEKESQALGDQSELSYDQLKKIKNSNKKVWVAYLNGKKIVSKKRDFAIFDSFTEFDYDVLVKENILSVTQRTDSGKYKLDKREYELHTMETITVDRLSGVLKGWKNGNNPQLTVVGTQSEINGSCKKAEKKF